MSFENSKQIEINGKKWNIDSFDKINMRANLSDENGYEFYSVPIGFLEEIGSNPVVEVPKMGEPVWSVYDNKSFPYISAGKMEGEFLVVYAPKDTVSGEIGYGKIKNWKPFNPEELE